MKIILKKSESNDLQQVLDEHNIKKLIEFERFCRDNSLWEDMEDCYAPNSEVKISWFNGSGKEFIEASRKMKNSSSHKIYDTLVWVHQNRAVAIMMTTIEGRIKIKESPLDLKSDAKLIFQLEKKSNSWKINKLEALYEKDALIPVFPDKGINLNNCDLSKYRDSYACLSFALDTAGYQINNNLPGADDPQLVSRLYQECDDWINLRGSN